MFIYHSLPFSLFPGFSAEEAQDWRNVPFQRMEEEIGGKEGMREQENDDGDYNEASNEHNDCGYCSFGLSGRHLLSWLSREDSGGLQMHVISRAL